VHALQASSALIWTPIAVSEKECVYYVRTYVHIHTYIRNYTTYIDGELHILFRNKFPRLSAQVALLRVPAT